VAQGHLVVNAIRFKTGAEVLLWENFIAIPFSIRKSLSYQTPASCAYVSIPESSGDLEKRGFGNSREQAKFVDILVRSFRRPARG